MEVEDAARASSKHSLVLADDHPLTSAGLAGILESRDTMEVVATAANGIEAIASIKTLQPDCAVLDLVMPGANGLEVVAESRRWSPDTRYAIVTGTREASMFQALVTAGVSGLFLKTTSPVDLLLGIERVCNGETVFVPEVTAFMEAEEETNELTSREMQVLQSLAKGRSNREIAEVLGVSPKTVDSHRSNIMRKFGVHSIATLLVEAMRQGLIGLENQP
ncbi:response regulator transcription factor [Ahrensia sp. R2A130]|uniref:LuxR C-terminal-related transcriptional regulator n=1 Tax=Ahrensia sp. R2A130 TaxID=744979 RepID=UPI00067FDD1D|nr:response regulator transcription factor [Ahrensia sp. R2A130]